MKHAFSGSKASYLVLKAYFLAKLYWTPLDRRKERLLDPGVTSYDAVWPVFLGTLLLTYGLPIIDPIFVLAHSGELWCVMGYRIQVANLKPWYLHPTSFSKYIS